MKLKGNSEQKIMKALVYSALASFIGVANASSVRLRERQIVADPDFSVRIDDDLVSSCLASFPHFLILKLNYFLLFLLPSMHLD